MKAPQLETLNSYFSYFNINQLRFEMVLACLSGTWGVYQPIPLSITLFDLDEGSENCINVTVESLCPLVISNLINSEQRDMS